jgi:predicted transcriptional regulator
MKRTLCEFIFWNVIPTIRREIAKSMVKDFGLTQRDAAKKLGITPAAVSLYISDKRGIIEIADSNIKDEIRTSAEDIIKNNNKSLTEETCRICKIIREKKIFPF